MLLCIIIQMGSLSCSWSGLKKEAAERKPCAAPGGTREESGAVAAGTRLTHPVLSVPQITALRFAGSLLLSAAYQRKQMSSKDYNLDLRESCNSVNPHRNLRAFVHLDFLFVSEENKWVKLWENTLFLLSHWYDGMQSSRTARIGMEMEEEGLDPCSSKSWIKSKWPWSLLLEKKTPIAVNFLSPRWLALTVLMMSPNTVATCSLTRALTLTSGPVRRIPPIAIICIICMWTSCCWTTLGGK